MASVEANELRALSRRLESLEEQPRRCLELYLRRLVEMSPESLCKLRDAESCLEGALVMVCNPPELLFDGSGEVQMEQLDKIKLSAEQERICEEGVTERCWTKERCVLARPSDGNGFYKALDDLRVESGKNYVLYYGGAGLEINHSFHFVPEQAERPQSLISIDDVMHYFDQLFFCCTFFIFINACRGSFGGYAATRQGCYKPALNTYVLVFSVPQGALADDGGEEGVTEFEKAVKKTLPCFKHSCDISEFSTTFTREYRKRGGEPSIVLHYGHGGIRPFTTGYTLLTQECEPMQQEHGIWVVEDWRKDHRRRLDRITGATVEPTCIILGSTSLDKDRYIRRFQLTGLSANYLITQEGQQYNLVSEELMAWDYNLAYWGGCGLESGFMQGKGRINELKSYSISIALEGEPCYTENQYQTLIRLLHGARARWQVDPWNILAAAEVLQEPPREKDQQPGLDFQWQRLVKEKLCLGVELPDSLQCSGSPRASEVRAQLRQQLEAWGYAFGSDSAAHFERRAAAFGRRYGVGEDEAALAAEQLLKRREEMRRRSRPPSLPSR